MLVIHENFSWYSEKEAIGIENPKKSGYPFIWGTAVFNDLDVIIKADPKHSTGDQKHWYAIGKPVGYSSEIVLTVRFEMKDYIHIFGCDYWSKNRELYERKKENR